jgi:DNA-binding XRE family transcriptional regulator
MNHKHKPIPISRVLKDFRTRFNLTQLSAAKWCHLPPGTYRDYEQGRSDPVKIVECGILARIADYEEAYEKYQREHVAAAVAQPEHAAT